MIPIAIRSLIILGALICGIASGQTINGTSADWTVISYTGSDPDPTADQQTGSAEADIVGDLANPSFYSYFDDAGTLSRVDGTLGFRVRVGAEQNPSGFSSAFFVGIDYDGDQALDVFVGVDNSGSGDKIAIWNPGTGTNTSPNTTSIVSPPYGSYTQSALNYNWRTVSTLFDGVGTDDLDGGTTGADFYLSFNLPYNDLVNYASAVDGVSIDQDSVFTYVSATATQDNSLNQDLNGVDGGINSSASFADLGVASDPISASGAAVPEPSSALLLMFATIGWLFRRQARAV